MWEQVSSAASWDHIRDINLSHGQDCREKTSRCALLEAPRISNTYQHFSKLPWKEVKPRYNLVVSEMLCSQAGNTDVHKTATRTPNCRLEVNIHLETEYLELGFRGLPRSRSKCWLSAQIFRVALRAACAAVQIRAQRNKKHRSTYFSAAQV